MEFKGTEDWKVSKFERDSSGRSCYRINEISKVSDKQLEANSKLIAAAPELLEALESCYVAMRHLPELSNECEIAYYKAEKAINKAII